MFETIRLEMEGRPDAVVLGLFEDKQTDETQPLWSEPAVRSALRRRECTGEMGNLVEAHPLTEEAPTVFLLGLGKRDKFAPELLRKAAATLGRRLAQTKQERVALELGAALAGRDSVYGGRCFGESVGLLGWNYTAFQGAGSKPKELAPLALQASDPAFREGLAQGLALATSTNFARDLSQTPPNVATPLWMASEAERMARETGLDCRVIQGEELEVERLVGLMTVGRASVHPPCLIRLAYRPENPTERKPLVLIGKTITYDTGGLTLKVNNGMVGMKRDKDGGCAVLGAMHAIATLIKPDVPVVGLLVAAENCVSDRSVRPDDVVTYRNGVSVEITNTDAEGRLVLADALCWACEVEQAAGIVDLATLTGGVVTALGSTYAGLFCEEEALRRDLDEASRRSGERIWRLPMHEEYREMLKSPVADIINSNPNRKAHPIQGAAFLSHFVTEETPWAHIDIAGVHATESDSGAFIKGPTGFGARLLADLAAVWNPE